MKTVLFHTCAVVLIFIALAALPAAAQSPTPERVYTTTSTDSTGNGASIVNGFTQTSSTGALSTTTGSPYAERLDGAAMAVDVKGRFLFVANPSNNSISMFQIDSSTGALTEVPTSPFASGPPSVGLLAPATPRALVGEPTGQYLYVGYQTGSATGESAIITYVIDAVHLALVPLPQSEVDQAANRRSNVD
jgi:6-phosphogluconolactonase (cycloisomerase 2 family)